MDEKSYCLHRYVDQLSVWYNAGIMTHYKDSYQTAMEWLTKHHQSQLRDSKQFKNGSIGMKQ